MGRKKGGRGGRNGMYSTKGRGNQNVSTLLGFFQPLVMPIFFPCLSLLPYPLLLHLFCPLPKFFHKSKSFNPAFIFVRILEISVVKVFGTRRLE